MKPTLTDHKIEFMAYSEDNNKIYTYSELDAMDKEGILFLIDVLHGFEKMYPMQLTALRSINNEPIYNHMIVKDKHGDLFCVDMFYYNLMAWLSNHELEIVGSRFQNPELLEQCK